MMNFSSENYDGVHPQIMAALAAANHGFAASYGNDRYTHEAIALFKREFGEDAEVCFTFNGTGANNLGLACMADRFHAIFCASSAHLYVDEATAPEAFIGARLYPVTTVDGKVTPETLAAQVIRSGDIHHPQGRVVTLTQPTEYGTVYSVAEMKAIKAFCEARGFLLHVDGARFFNAAAALDVSLADLSTKVGVDVLTLGGTKAGLMFGEAVVLFNHPAKETLRYMHKRSMQLASKNRFIAVQFSTLLGSGLWKEVAGYTNHLAGLFERSFIPNGIVSIAYPVQTNMVFLKMPESAHNKVSAQANFYYWNTQLEEVRLVFSFSNTEDEVLRFVEILSGLAG